MIPAQKNLTKNYWTSARTTLLGTMSDEALAKRLGIKRTSVFYKRKELNIPSFRQSHTGKWDLKAIRMLGKKSDQEVACILGVHKTTVVNKRKSLEISAFAHQSKLWRKWSAEELAMLGQYTDKEIARRLKITVDSVSSKRRNMQIEAYSKSGQPTKPRVNGVIWTRQHLALLGKVPDGGLAEMMGVNRKTIIKKRQSLGIQRYVSSFRGSA